MRCLLSFYATTLLILQANYHLAASNFVDGGDDSSQRRTELCDMPSGELNCLHGGKCAFGHDEWSQTIEEALCDCRTAVDFVDDNDSMEPALYVGKECQIPVLPELYCSSNKDLFCVNGGNCRNEASNYVDEPCSCTTGFSGRHCEYAATDVQSVCSLTCSGHGQCQHGISLYGDKGANIKLNLVNATTKDFMHCVCDDGFAGMHCDVLFDKCEQSPKAEFCFHGSVCSEVGETQPCDCGDQTVAGTNCQYRASDTCDSPGMPSLSSYEFGMNTLEDAFCVNKGVCVKVDFMSLYHCECLEGYTGVHCEVPEAVQTTPAQSPPGTDTSSPTADSSEPDRDFFPGDSSNSGDEDSLEGGAKFGIIAGVLFSVAFLSFVIVYFKRRARMINRAIYRDNQNDLV
mmetsp:Transcript_16141/g.21104  ORF Transcript_16141/g.21104 Transcript_16141/m.21104 type:complete len:401 (-) Transcript_16141:80-1282(-)